MSDPFRQNDISPRRQAFDRAFLRAVARAQIGLALHWLFLLNAASALYVGLAFLAPVLMALGWEAAGRSLFDAYSVACHQYPQRSFFVVGHQVAFCQRDVATFTAIFIAGLVYSRLRREVRPLRWWLYVLLVAPMGIDGLTQLAGWRESTWELRTATGALFGLATVWLLYPYIERTMDEMLNEAIAALAREGGSGRPQLGGG